MKSNGKMAPNDRYRRFYLIGFFIILALPLLSLPPYFSPPDWGKTVVFRSIVAILIFLFIQQAFSPSGRAAISKAKEILRDKGNGLYWVLRLFIALFLVFLLATVFSQNIKFSLWGTPYRAGGFVTFSFYLFLSVLLFLTVESRDWKKLWDWALTIGSFVAIIGILQYFKIFAWILRPFGMGAVSTTGNSTFLAIYLLLLVFVSLCFGLKENSKKRFFYFFSVLLFVFGIFVSGCRAAYLGLLFGGIYFLLFYPKKVKKLKIAAALILVLTISVIFYVNYANIISKPPDFVKNNRTLSGLVARLSLGAIAKDLGETRFSAWKITSQAILAKPVLGWGPENMQIGFDRHYDPSLFSMTRLWWDRAHNVFLDIGVSTGIFGLTTYILFFIVLFWQLQKAKKVAAQVKKCALVPHSIQTALVGYFVANFFSFDSFVTYLVLFFIVAYAFFLISKSGQRPEKYSDQISPAKKYKPYFTVPAFIFLICFLWFANIRPFWINAQINMAEYLVEHNKCELAFQQSEKAIAKHSFLDLYSRLKYYDLLKTCEGYYPDKTLEYAQKGVAVLKEQLKDQPTYTRFWIVLGSLTNILMAKENKADAKADLMKEAYIYLETAEKLSPKRQETIITQAQTDFLAGNYHGLKEKAEKCLDLSKNYGACYWYLALAEIFAGENEKAEKDIQMAKDHGFNVFSEPALHQAAVVYQLTKNYKGLQWAYYNLVAIRPDNAQYRATLAFVYKELGDIERARHQASFVLMLQPEAKEEVQIFLDSLDPTNPNSHRDNAIIYAEFGEYEKARREALLWLKLQPEAKKSVEEFLDSLPH